MKYGEFAQYYDELMQDIDYKNWYKYLQSIVQEKNFNYSTVLEMACGTGNMTRYIIEDKNVRKVTCFDLSEDMLTVAREKFKNLANIEILKQDMTDVKIKGKYDLILSSVDSINYILSEEKLEKTFEKVHSLLVDKGLFIFDINSFNKLKNIIGENTFVHDEDEVYYVWENEFEESTNISNFYLTFFIKDEERYIRFDEHHREKAYREKDIVKALKGAGFKDIDIRYDFNDKGIGNEENSERIFLICEK